MSRMSHVVPAFALLALVILCGNATGAAEAGYYREEPLFHYYPAADTPRWTVGRLGPIGLSLELLQPAFTMRIAGVEPGSPAEATGQLRRGQYIESINGQVLKDVDPRIILGNLITEAEATDGRVVLMIKEDRDAEAVPVTVRIPVLGAYSETWPVNCRKSDAIVRRFADYLARSDQRGWGAALFLLSTGEEQDLEVVRDWFSGLSADHVGFPWSIGYDDTALCEYYLRTGDESVLPAIQARADYLKRTIYNGSWMGRGGANFRYMAGGHMNAAGVHCLTFLLMAKECGVDVDEHTLQSALAHFYRYVGHGNVSYGDAFPEGGFTDNGRVAKLAFAMQAAANLVPDGENSVYARARDISATKSFYATSWLFHGHTGGGIGELWRGPAMGLLREARPRQYRSFMDERRWIYELARTHEGAFGWADGQNVGYTGVNISRPSGNFIPLVFTQHRRQLRMFGAPPTQFSRTYALPERPWGTPADDAFYALTAGEVAPGVKLDVSQETIRTGASRALFRLLGDAGTADETVLKYALHIDQAIRDAAVERLLERGRIDALESLLRSEDPRGRHSGAKGLGRWNGPLTDGMVARLGGIAGDPEESWWVAQEALKTLGRATADQLAPFVDDLDRWLDHWDWWMQAAAVDAVAPLAADPRFSARILPRIGEVMKSSRNAPILGHFFRLVNRVKEADPEVLGLALETLSRVYADFPAMLPAPGGQDMSQGTQYMLDHMAQALASTPGGFDALFRISQQRFPGESLPHLDLYLQADTDRFGSELREAFEPIIRDQVIWRYVGEHLRALEREIRSREPDRAVAGLVNLYRRVGTAEYDWRLWGPARDTIAWQYFSYDPREERLWERGGEYGGRYRPVSWPEGAEGWMRPGFDARRAGWRTGLAPFAHNDGKLAPVGSCVGDHHFCGCGNPPNTFWENEVLLMRTELELPAMRDGFAYRFLVGGRSHVGSGEGTDVWINGTRREGRRREDPSLRGVGRRVGGQPWGFVINDEFRKNFTGGSVTLAATGFLPIHRSGVKRNYQAFWFETMRLPALGEPEMLEVLRVTPLRTSAWQASLDGRDAFQFDGAFEANPAILGRWRQRGRVAAMADFDPAARMRVDRNAPFQEEVTFKPEGRTDDFKVMYSGDLLLDLAGGQGLKMQLRTLDGSEYLFIEAGGFREDQAGDWQTSYYVMQRARE